MDPYKIVLLRHGESLWNKENRFTGWTDVDLSETGCDEAREAGDLLKKEGYSFDCAYTSVLKRAIRTLWIVQDQMDLMWLPVTRSWHLNEKHYGALQGLNKAETAEKYGDEQVLQWRRAYDVRPPALGEDDPRHPLHEDKYQGIPKDQLPSTECLKDTVGRFMPYWHEVISSAVQEGKHVLIVAHGNSLRALVKHLDQISDEEIIKLNIPTGIPLVYELDQDLSPIKHYYLGDQAKVSAAQASVASQGKSNH